MPKLPTNVSTLAACLLAACLVTALAGPTVRGAEPDSAGLILFEKRIRPVLVEHCYECHSADKKVKGGLRLDSPEAWQKGGDSGPAIEPGKPDESLLIDALRHEGDLKMPPRGKLSDAVLRDFEEWVRRGAPDPRHATEGKPAAPGSAPGPMDIEAGRRHWAYRPVGPGSIPPVRGELSSQSPVDRFVQARQEHEPEKTRAGKTEPANAADIRDERETPAPHPAPRADRQTLIRRISFDLTGLPPTIEEIDTFLADSAPEAWERLVDRLLASPRFGERWARHWFDVVRFAESITLRGFVFKEAWRYRDYVIDAFDRDLPYDEFLREQIAGDLLPGGTLSERQRRLIATTVLMLGNTNLEEQDKSQLEMDLIDEQLDVIGRGFLAQTITCARCHDHKFDPIPTRDYYALAGILKNARSLDHENVSKWIERPLPLEPERESVYRLHEAELARLEADVKGARDELKKLAVASPAVLAARDLPGIVVDDAAARRVGAWQHSQSVRQYIGEGYLHDSDEGKGEKTLSFDPDLPESGNYEVRLAYTHAGNRAGKVPVTVFSAEGEKTIEINEREAPAIDGRFVSLGQYRFEKGGQSFVIVSTVGTKGHVVADAVQFLPVNDRDGAGAPQSARKSAPPAAESDAGKKLREEISRLEKELKARKAAGPKRPMVMSVIEKTDPGDLYVHVRGSVHGRGPVVPRGFLQVASTGTTPKIPAEAGGRLQLADWIASRENPLTARVFVNRVWHWLFGAGLVRTTDNFGTTGETPSHPELLDHLAFEFMRDGWSVKRLIRRIVLSETYRRSAAVEAATRSRDPENRLLGHGNRRRLDAECLRDAMLVASGQLRDERGGPGFPAGLAADYGFVDHSPRRSVYLSVFRNALPEIFEVFDFADPSLVTGRRNTSTVAPQALFLMNHPFVLEQSRRAAERLLAEGPAADADRLRSVYRQILGRAPTAIELEAGLQFLADKAPGSQTDRWAELIQALFATLEFRYLD
jgi:hypothetical protein